MEIGKSRQGEIVILKISGRMDLEGITPLREIIISSLDKDVTAFVFNLTDVTNISSSGIGLLLDYHQDLKGKKVKLVLTNLPPAVKYVLDITRVYDVFPVFISDEEAFAYLTDSGSNK